MTDLGQALKKSGSLFLFREVMWEKKNRTPHPTANIKIPNMGM